MRVQLISPFDDAEQIWIGLDEPGHRVAEQGAQRVAARVEQRRVDVEVLLLRQHLRQPPRVADRGLQRRRDVAAQTGFRVAPERRRRPASARAGWRSRSIASMARSIAPPSAPAGPTATTPS